jgi:hypothetical protein
MGYHIAEETGKAARHYWKLSRMERMRYIFAETFLYMFPPVYRRVSVN